MEDIKQIEEGGLNHKRVSLVNEVKNDECGNYVFVEHNSIGTNYNEYNTNPHQ